MFLFLSSAQMLPAPNERAREVLAGEHPAAGHLRHRAAARRAALRRVRQVLREPGADGARAAEVKRAADLRCSAEKVTAMRHKYKAWFHCCSSTGSTLGQC